MSLMPRSRLTSDSARSPTIAVAVIASAEDQALPDGGVQQDTTGEQAAGEQAGGERTAQTLPGLLRRDPRREGVADRMVAPAAYPPTSLQTTVAMKVVTTRREPSCGAAMQQREATPSRTTYTRIHRSTRRGHRRAAGRRARRSRVTAAATTRQAEDGECGQQHAQGEILRVPRFQAAEVRPRQIPSDQRRQRHATAGGRPGHHPS